MTNTAANTAPAANTHRLVGDEVLLDRMGEILRGTIKTINADARGTFFQVAIHGTSFLYPVTEGQIVNR